MLGRPGEGLNEIVKIPKDGNDPQGPRGHEIYNFGSSSLAHHYYIFSLSARCTGVKMIFKDTMHFHFMTIWGHTLSQEPLT